MAQMDTDGGKGGEEARLNKITEIVIGCAFKVGGTLGTGYLEKVYENALMVELKKAGLNAVQQQRLIVRYEGDVVGEYVSDLVVENSVVVEIKAGKGIDDSHVAQAINYLASTGLPIALILNFTTRVQVRRVVSKSFSSPASVSHLCPSVPSVAGCSLAAAIAITWKRNGAYCVRLVEDLTNAQWVGQPIVDRVMNHPAWVISHLNLYNGIVGAMLRGDGFEDPINHPHGQGSAPSMKASAYPQGQDLIKRFKALHGTAEQGLEGVTAEALAKPNPLERWRAVHPTVGDMLVTLMVKHESGHLGQLSAWRRAMGLGSVPM